MFCNFHQNSNDIQHKDWKINPKVHLEAQKTVNSQENPEQKEHCRSYHNTHLQIILQSYTMKTAWY
jgi:hypothetical protein